MCPRCPPVVWPAKGAGPVRGVNEAFKSLESRLSKKRSVPLLGNPRAVLGISLSSGRQQIEDRLVNFKRLQLQQPQSYPARFLLSN